ncbi:MAG: S8 family serine peptidase [Blastocatellia bacterium]|nr:S8 family serine peptidase [Blastocatellia bacterium]
MFNSKQFSESSNHTNLEARFGIIPTPLRLEADQRFSGEGVTIAFLDSGFYAHPDLTQPENRILKYIDITKPQDGDRQLYADPVVHSWHGTQTAVAATGNGYLSNGHYAGIASKAKLVLVKVGSKKGIEPKNIEAGLKWVLQNRERYQIKLVNISLGADEDIPYKDSAIDLAAEALVEAGVVVVVSAGNSGCTDQPNVTPPGNSPSVITVGGYDDKNTPGNHKTKALCDTPPSMYCSSFGPTADGFLKPELLAPAIWVPAPILPKTKQFDRVEALWKIASATRQAINREARRNWEAAQLPEMICEQVPPFIRAMVERALREMKAIHPKYQHVDGTSFAAPLVTSVIAQMLEANPKIPPRVVKQILTSTAIRVPYFPVLRQGYGILDAPAAVAEALSDSAIRDYDVVASPVIDMGEMTFLYHNSDAQSVSLAGDFNGWSTKTLHMKKDLVDGLWRISLPALPPGRYRYKYIVDNSKWVEDPGNCMREPDGHKGFNSILKISD